MAVKPRLTLEQFLQMEETRPYSEFVCGEAIQKPMPTFSHSAIQIYLGALLLNFLNRTGLGRVLSEFRCIFGPPGRERAFVADVTYVAKEHLPIDRYLHTAPELAIEILSPDQPMAQFLDKIQFYLLNGVRLVWVIDPEAQTIAVLRPGEEVQILTINDTLDGGEVLPGFSVPVAEIFAQAEQPTEG